MLKLSKINGTSKMLKESVFPCSFAIGTDVFNTVVMEYRCGIPAGEVGEVDELNYLSCIELFFAQ